MGAIIALFTYVDIRASNGASYKNKIRPFLSFFSKEERNSLKVTLKLVQEARMGPF